MCFHKTDDMFELLHWWRWWGWVDLKFIGAIKSEQPVLAIKLPERGGSENHQWLPCQICCFPNVKDLGHVWWQVTVGWRFGWFQTCKMYFLGHFLGCHWMRQNKSAVILRARKIFLGPRGPLVLLSVGSSRSSARKIWITYIQAYMPHESWKDSSNQPYGPMGSPHRPHRPQRHVCLSVWSFISPVTQVTSARIQIQSRGPF